MKNSKCRNCNNEFTGRNNQFFCGIDCKNEFHNSKKQKTIDIIEITPDDFRNFQEKYKILTSNYENKELELQTEHEKYAKLKSAYVKIKKKNEIIAEELRLAKEELIAAKQNVNQAATIGVKNLLHGLLGR